VPAFRAATLRTSAVMLDLSPTIFSTKGSAEERIEPI
jgi:hypothetical protein